MRVVDLIGWACAGWVLAAYAWLAHSGRGFAFDVANAIGFVGIIASALVHHAYPSAAITITFGMIGWYSIIRRFTGRRPLSDVPLVAEQVEGVEG